MLLNRAMPWLFTPPAFLDYQVCVRVCVGKSQQAVCDTHELFFVLMLRAWLCAIACESLHGVEIRMHMVPSLACVRMCVP